MHLNLEFNPTINKPMADRKGLLNEIALLTNLLGTEDPKSKKKVHHTGKSYPFPRAKANLVIRQEKVQVGSSFHVQSLKPLTAAAVLAVIKGVSSANVNNINKVQDLSRIAAHKNISTESLRFNWVTASGKVLKPRTAIASTSTSVVGPTKYNVERRVLKSTGCKIHYNPMSSISPSRKFSGGNLTPLVKYNAKRNQLSSPIRKFSIRKYSIRKLKSVASDSYSREIHSANLYLKGIGTGSHEVVRINGTKYVSKNTGKSLKRIRTSSAHLSNFQSLSKSPSTSHRVANRALQRSITTLSGGKKQNRVCYFLRNFGYCRRKENSTCPFFHGLSTISNHNVSPVVSGPSVKRCHYFRTGKCLRKNCPYLHVLSPSPIRGKESPKQQRQRLLSLRSRGLRRRRKLSNTQEKKESTETIRYFNKEPEINPLSSVITRRLPKGVENIICKSIPDPIEIKTLNQDPIINCDIKAVQNNGVQMVSSTISKCTPCVEREGWTSGDATEQDHRRQRLMSKLLTFNKRLGKGPTEMPTFLPF